MITLNTNFIGQENKTSAAGDQSEKENGSDHFGTLMAGLCMNPQANSTVVSVSASGKSAQESDGETPGGNQADLASGASGASPASTVSASDPNATQDLPQEAVDAIKKFCDQTDNGDIKSARPDITIKPKPLPGDVKPAPAKGDVKTERPEIEIKPKPLPGGFKTDPSNEPVLPIAGMPKQIIKGIKTQANKFEEAPAISGSGPISAAKSFAVFAKEKALIVRNLLDGTQVQFGPATAGSSDTASEVNITHFEHNYVVDPLRLDDFIRDRAQRKMPKLISEISDIATEENPSILQGELVSQTDAPLLPKVTAMLEQVRPALIQLAAAAAGDEGKQILKMRLHPAELGTVEIRLEKNSFGVLEAHFKTDTDAARHFLTQGMDQLRASLQDAGWQVGKVEISSNSQSSGGDSAQSETRRRSETSSNGSAKSFEPAPAVSDGNLDGSADHLVSLRA